MIIITKDQNLLQLMLPLELAIFHSLRKFMKEMIL